MLYTCYYLRNNIMTEIVTPQYDLYIHIVYYFHNVSCQFKFYDTIGVTWSCDILHVNEQLNLSTNIY